MTPPNPTVAVHVRIAPDLKRRVEEAAAREGLTLTAYTERAYANELASAVARLGPTPGCPGCDNAYSLHRRGCPHEGHHPFFGRETGITDAMAELTPEALEAANGPTVPEIEDRPFWPDEEAEG